MIDKIIESLGSKLDTVLMVEALKPIQLTGVQIKKNVILQLNNGHLFAGLEKEPLQPGSFYFMPSGQSIHVKHGKGTYFEVEGAEFRDPVERAAYIRNVSCQEELPAIAERFTLCRFEVLLYDAIPVFDLLGIPPFTLPHHKELDSLIFNLAMENELDRPGRSRMIGNYLEEIVIHLCRYIGSHSRFEKYLEKLQFLTDRRLVDIVKFIGENLEKDLSNKKIAQVALVSEDYVGQFFKSVTGQNLQDYIELQRLERAMHLIKTRPDPIHEIAGQVGFKDPAYFSRRFKMKFGMNANSVRFERDQLF